MEEKKRTPLEAWRENLKEGDLIRVIHYHCQSLGIFKSFNQGNGTYCGCRMQYYNVPEDTLDRGVHNWCTERLEEWEKKGGTPYVSYINARGEERVLPADERYLGERTKDYCKRVQKLLR